MVQTINQRGTAVQPTTGSEGRIDPKQFYAEGVSALAGGLTNISRVRAEDAQNAAAAAKAAKATTDNDALSLFAAQERDDQANLLTGNTDAFDLNFFANGQLPAEGEPVTPEEQKAKDTALKLRTAFVRSVENGQSEIAASIVRNRRLVPFLIAHPHLAPELKTISGMTELDAATITALNADEKAAKDKAKEQTKAQEDSVLKTAQGWGIDTYGKSAAEVHAMPIYQQNLSLLRTSQAATLAAQAVNADESRTDAVKKADINKILRENAGPQAYSLLEQARQAVIAANGDPVRLVEAQKVYNDGIAAIKGSLGPGSDSEVVTKFLDPLVQEANSLFTTTDAAAKTALDNRIGFMQSSAKKMVVDDDVEGTILHVNAVLGLMPESFMKEVGFATIMEDSGVNDWLKANLENQAGLTGKQPTTAIYPIDNLSAGQKARQEATRIMTKEAPDKHTPEFAAANATTLGQQFEQAISASNSKPINELLGSLSTPQARKWVQTPEFKASVLGKSVQISEYAMGRGGDGTGGLVGSIRKQTGGGVGWSYKVGPDGNIYATGPQVAPGQPSLAPGMGYRQAPSSLPSLNQLIGFLSDVSGQDKAAIAEQYVTYLTN